MLLNLTNHPAERWSEMQKETAVTQFGHIKDMDFPYINPEWDSRQILDLAEFYASKCYELKSKEQLQAVHLMGEMTFCTALVLLLKKHNIKSIVSTTHRNVSFNKEGVKESEFSFCRFREYVLP